MTTKKMSIKSKNVEVIDELLTTCNRARRKTKHESTYDLGAAAESNEPWVKEEIKVEVTKYLGKMIIKMLHIRTYRI